MSKGLPDDTRKFQRPYLYDVTKGISDKKPKPPRCCYCKQIIVGKAWRVDSKNVECTLCHNETSSNIGNDFDDYDFHVEDFG